MKNDLLGKSQELFDFAKTLWPLNRSLTGQGVRETLEKVKDKISNLEIKEIPSGRSVFDWITPDEWFVGEAYIITPNGEKICDYKTNNLHLVQYSTPVSIEISLEDLKPHLHYLENQPNAIPYVTSYYNRAWGFCLSYEQFCNLPDGNYKIVIDTSLSNGVLNYGELLINGKSKKEVVFSTYICHPSLANNEISGIVVTAFLAQYLLGMDTNLSYRFLFLPETIGSIAYLHENLDHLKKHVIAGYVVTCVGDERQYSFLPSRFGNTTADFIAKYVFEELEIDYKTYSWSDRGSDERQFCSPGVDLPIASIMRSKYSEYPEYHTSLDKLGDVVTGAGLSQSLYLYSKVVETLEKTNYPKTNITCEPFLTKYELHPTLSIKGTGSFVRKILDVTSWADGHHSDLEIAFLTSLSLEETTKILNLLISKGIVQNIN